MFERTSDRIRTRFERRFPHVNSDSSPRFVRDGELGGFWVAGHYRQATQLAADAGGDGALALYLTEADPLPVLRDLLGAFLGDEHRKLSTPPRHHRVYREAYECRFGGGPFDDDAAEREADAEFAGGAESGVA